VLLRGKERKKGVERRCADVACAAPRPARRGAGPRYGKGGRGLRGRRLAWGRTVPSIMRASREPLPDTCWATACLPQTDTHHSAMNTAVVRPGTSPAASALGGGDAAARSGREGAAGFGGGGCGGVPPRALPGRKTSWRRWVSQIRSLRRERGVAVRGARRETGRRRGGGRAGGATRAVRPPPSPRHPAPRSHQIGHREPRRAAAARLLGLAIALGGVHLEHGDGLHDLGVEGLWRLEQVKQLAVVHL